MNLLNDTLKANNGIITTLEANKIGISNEYLRILVKRGILERVAFGIYMRPNDFIDKMYVTQLNKRQVIYSHDTALFLHDLTDRDPINYVVTVPSGYNTTNLKKEGFKVFTINKKHFQLGITKVRTMYGNEVLVYNLERNICDCIRNRNQMDIALITEAMKRYVARKDRDLNTLMQMAEIFRVTKILKKYMEVLL